jgi:hypothetical protein
VASNPTSRKGRAVLGLVPSQVRNDLIQVDLIGDESSQRRGNDRHGIPRLPNPDRFPHAQNDCGAWPEEFAGLGDGSCGVV